MNLAWLPWANNVHIWTDAPDGDQTVIFTVARRTRGCPIFPSAKKCITKSVAESLVDDCGWSTVAIADVLVPCDDLMTAVSTAHC